MLDLTVSEEFVLPVPLDEAHAICKRAILSLEWDVQDETASRLQAREKGLWGIKGLGTKNSDLSLVLSRSDPGTRAQLTLSQNYGMTWAPLYRRILQEKTAKIRQRIADEIPGNVPPPLPPLKGRVFISYRRSDSADVTGRIHDRLVAHFGEGNVFQDVEDIPLGMDFTENVLDVIGKCDALLAIIGDKWLTAVDEKGGRRLDRPDDYVRNEIESALGRKIPLIPVLVGRAEMPGPDVLPDSLRKLSTRNAIHVRPNPDFRPDMTRLIEGLEELFARKA